MNLNYKLNIDLDAAVCDATTASGCIAARLRHKIIKPGVVPAIRNGK